MVKVKFLRDDMPYRKGVTYEVSDAEAVKLCERQGAAVREGEGYWPVVAGGREVVVGDTEPVWIGEMVRGDRN